MTAPVITTDRPDHTDLAAIRAVIAQAEHAFNTDDADLLVASMAADVVAVGVNGARVLGREAVLATARAAFAGPLRDQYARYEVVDVSCIGPDVALAHKNAHATSADGVPIDVGHAMTALYVLARRDGRWWIVARQNTLVSPPPVRSSA